MRVRELKTNILKNCSDVAPLCKIFLTLTFLLSASTYAADYGADEKEMPMMGPESLWQSSGECGDMGVWDVSMAMCMPLPMAGMPMKMLMVHGNIFGTEVLEQSPRGRNRLASTSMLMTDIGQSIGEHHYLNLDLMLTAEKWTIPQGGYPLLLQIGERDSQGRAYIDAQHPHSSPIMGLTLSDTFAFGREKDHVKFFFAPRGEATDGPVAFMHRMTGIVNPDAPLGHHIGQDVGHITSTVVGASVKLSTTRLEISGYHGQEPEPDHVDLPFGSLDSVSLRLIEEFTPELMAMISAARVSQPEEDQNDIKFENRYSASIYYQKSFARSWTFYNTLIYGAVTQYDHAAVLSSFAEEFLFRGLAPHIFGRLEVLQRTPAELSIAGASQNEGSWIGAVTAGYSHTLIDFSGAELALGASVSHYFLPRNFQSTYDGNPWSGKLFLELSGMRMFDL